MSGSVLGQSVVLTDVNRIVGMTVCFVSLWAGSRPVDRAVGVATMEIAMR